MASKEGVGSTFCFSAVLEYPTEPFQPTKALDLSNINNMIVVIGNKSLRRCESALALRMEVHTDTHRALGWH